MSIAFNDKQKEAIEYIDSPLLIIAGAGSGKTMVITHKVAYLINKQGYLPESILAITFTNKATLEMKERIDSLIGEDNGTPYISTFHAFCSDVLRHHYDKIGGTNNYIIFDSNDQKRLIKNLITELEVDDKVYPVAKVIGMIEAIKNKLQTFQDYEQDSNADSVIAMLYTRYQTTLHDNKAVDFTDMLFYTYQLFNTKPDVLSYYQQKYKYVLVDEYQDTNLIQYHLIKFITGVHNQLTAVGDFDQNIYSWRGASTKHILNFERDYKGARIIMLEQNYRSTQNILSAANALIEHNIDRKDKKLWTENKDGELITHFNCKNEQEEATFIAGEVRALMDKGIAYKEMVILYRINAMSRVLEEKLTFSQIPFQIIGGLQFFDRKEIKDVISYLRFIYNPEDSYAFSRVVNVPSRQIGAVTVKKVLDYKKSNNCTFDEVLNSEDLLTDRAKHALTEFFDVIKKLRGILDSEKVDVIGKIITTLLEDVDFETYFEKEGKKVAQDRLENILELVSFAREEELTIGDFLNKVSLRSDTDQIAEDADFITLMTMHHAKGLEYKAVFIVGCEEGILPHYRSKGFPDQLEEERRLCYVGITRGKQNVYMISCRERHLFGDIRYQETSRFLREIPSVLLKVRLSPTLSVGEKRFPSESTMQFDQFQSSFKSVSSQSYTVGDSVKHTSWGTGVIDKIDGTGEDSVLYINFSGEVKKLISKYAPLTKV